MASQFARLRAVIARIPRSKVATYGQVAAGAGIPRGARLTVRALLGSDWLPWHRVVAAGGRIALRGAAGWEQRMRLETEGVTFRGQRVVMRRHNWVPRPPGAKRYRARSERAVRPRRGERVRQPPA